MPATKFDKDVSALQNVMIPAAEKAAGHALLPSDRYAITKLIRESLVNPEPGKVAELKAWVTPKAAPARSFTETAKVTGFLEQAPAVPSPAPSAPTNTLLEESIKAELPYLRQRAHDMLLRNLTPEEDKDLENTLRQRLAGTTKVTNIGESLMARGRHKSPFFAPGHTAAQISESAAKLPDEAEMAAISRLPRCESAEAFRAALQKFPLSLGGKRS